MEGESQKGGEGKAVKVPRSKQAAGENPAC